MTRFGEIDASLAITKTDARFEGMLYQAVFLRSFHRLLVKTNLVPSSPILVTLMMAALPSSEVSVLTGAICCKIPQDGILLSHCHENLKPYIELTGLTL
jgi:hypothetical protein